MCLVIRFGEKMLHVQECIFILSNQKQAAVARKKYPQVLKEQMEPTHVLVWANVQQAIGRFNKVTMCGYTIPEKIGLKPKFNTVVQVLTVFIKRK